MPLERTLSRAPKDQRISALGAFMWQCLRNPFRTGAVVPSSRALAMAMARQVLRRNSGTIVEFGPGTGAITAALLDLGIARDRLYLVERSAEFASVLRMRFPGVRVVEGDAVKLREYTLRDGVKEITAIVSGLPLRLLDHQVRASILLQSFASMADSGTLVQFTYSHRPPVPPAVLARLGLETRNIGAVWRNLPPASIWEFRRANPPAFEDDRKTGGNAEHGARGDNRCYALPSL
jgi:phosphatidylethanolamine/phosphatidyl-N-methylethanolamine N-methyltransferase